MRKARNLLFTMAIALGIISLSYSCSEKDINPIPWDNGKIPGSVVGTWYGDYGSDAIFSIPSGRYTGKRLYGNKEVNGFQFNEDGTGICYNYLCNVAGEAINMFGGSMDNQNGRFTYVYNPDSTITITRVGDGNASNPKVWQAALTEEGLRIMYGNNKFTMNKPRTWEQEELVGWEKKLRKGANGDDVYDEVYDSSFLNSWWKQTYMTLADIGKVVTPWGDASTSESYDIPDEQRYYNSKSYGWEMCFCKFNDNSSESSKKLHYFGLYNKWNGVFRVFFYADPDHVSEYGNELIFSYSSSKYDSIKTPMYHALNYGFPVNHTIGGGNLSSSLNLTGPSSSSVSGWKWYQSPFSTSTSATGVQAGWHVVDFDMSAFKPGGKNWATSTDSTKQMVTIRPLSRNTSTMTLTGELMGSVQGSETTYWTEMQTSSSNPSFSSFYNYWSTMSNSITSSGMGLMMMAGATSGAGIGIAVGSAVLSLVTGIMGCINQSYMETEEVEDSCITNVNLAIDADMNLSGEVDSWTSISDASIDLKQNLFKKANENCHIGKGLWSLADDPVVYVDKEDLLANTDHYTIRASSDGLSLSSFDGTDTRLIYFIDPSSIKININDSIYHNIHNVKMQCGIAICTDQDLGNTDCYRTTMSLEDRPTFTLSNATSGNVKMDGTTTPRIVELSVEDIEDQYDSGFDGMFEKDSIPADYTLRTYGPVKSYSGFKRMLFPQVYVPYDGSTIKDAEAPDLYVYVDVGFDCDEGTGVELIKHFVPQIKLCTRDEMRSWYDTLKTYYDNSANGSATGTLNYPSGIEVTDINACNMFTPMLYTMKQVLDY